MAQEGTNDLKSAHREGMARSRAVSRYLDALYEHRPRRGRKRNPESVRTKMAEIDSALPGATGLARLRMMQEQKNLARSMAELNKAHEVDLASLEADFIAHAKSFSEREGIEYSTWIACGVPRSVLAKASIRPIAGRPPLEREASASH